MHGETLKLEQIHSRVLVKLSVIHRLGFVTKGLSETR